MAAPPLPGSALAPGVRARRIEPLQRRIERNRLRFAVFMVAFTALAALSLFVAAVVALGIVALMLYGAAPAAGAAFGGAAPAALAVAAAVCLLAAWAWTLTRLVDPELALLRRLEARMPTAGTLMPTKSMLRDVALAAGLPKPPALYVIETPAVNAFVLGISPARIRVGVTRGLIERIDLDEQRAVFANLVARVLSQDTLWATAVSVLMGPIWAMREYDLRYEPRMVERRQTVPQRSERMIDDWRGGIVAYGAAVVLTELLAWYHQEAAWTAAEKADAEGMMLLKDPRSMLGAIEHVLDRNNHVPTAGDAYSQLFYCWAGYGFAPEDDPEMRRVARLRETLGAEGAAYQPRPNVPAWPSAPVAPRIGLACAEGATDES